MFNCWELWIVPGQQFISIWTWWKHVNKMRRHSPL